MSYQIRYGDKAEKIEISRQKKGGNGAVLLTVCLLMTAAIIVAAIGTDRIRSFLIPGDDIVTVQAFNNFTEDLRSGGSFPDAAVAFCREIIENAQIS